MQASFLSSVGYLRSCSRNRNDDGEREQCKCHRGRRARHTCDVGCDPGATRGEIIPPDPAIHLRKSHAYELPQSCRRLIFPCGDANPAISLDSSSLPLALTESSCPMTDSSVKGMSSYKVELTLRDLLVVVSRQEIACGSVGDSCFGFRFCGRGAPGSPRSGERIRRG